MTTRTPSASATSSPKRSTASGKRAIAEQHVQAAPSESAEARRWSCALEAAEAAEDNLRGYAADVADVVHNASDSDTEA